MKFGFKELEQVLAAAHHVSPEGRSKFSAGLRNLFRVGLSLPAGRVGRRTNYGPEDLLKMALAVELLQIGLLPAMVAASVSEYWPEFRGYIAMERNSRRVDGRPLNRYLALEPTLMTDRAIARGNFDRMAGARKFMFDRRVLSFRRAAVINVGMVWDDIESALRKADIDKDAFLAAVDMEDANLLAGEKT